MNRLKIMDNKIAIEYRKKLPKSNNFNIRELREMPQYFGWVNYVINEKNEVDLFLGGNDDGVALRCFWNNHYEKKTLEIWAKLSVVEGIILDIGAHSGIYSLVANKSIQKGAVLSFEPHYLNFSRLNLNLRANSISTKSIFMNAVGAKNETLPFSVNQDSNYLTSGGKIGKFKKKTSTPIQVLAIDNILDVTAKKNVKIIKIDVEGHEYECLLGMKQTLIESHPIIFFECMSLSNNSEIEIFLNELEYTIFSIDDWEGTIKETKILYPIFDNNNNIIHQKINRLAAHKTKIDLLSQILT
mgnify:FL=1